MRLPFFPALFALAITPLLRAEQPAQANEFEKEIAAFEAADKTNPPPQGAILMEIASWRQMAAK